MVRLLRNSLQWSRVHTERVLKVSTIRHSILLKSYDLLQGDLSLNRGLTYMKHNFTLGEGLKTHILYILKTTMFYFIIMNFTGVLCLKLLQ